MAEDQKTKAPKDKVEDVTVSDLPDKQPTDNDDAKVKGGRAQLPTNDDSI